MVQAARLKPPAVPRTCGTCCGPCRCLGQVARSEMWKALFCVNHIVFGLFCTLEYTASLLVTQENRQLLLRTLFDAGRLTSPVAFGNKAMKCEGSEDVLQTVLMANPDQASSLQGSHSVDCDILALNDLGTGSGWQQSKQNQALLAVVGKLARTGCSHLSSVELSSLRLFYLFLWQPLEEMPAVSPHPEPMYYVGQVHRASL
jgi:hypothetical protein